MANVLTTGRPTSLAAAPPPQVGGAAEHDAIQVLVTYRNQLLAEIRYVDREIERLTRLPVG